jgi:hypothetical protein
MRVGGGSQKGAAWEREACRRLSLWITKGERDDLLWRTAMSGGRATIQFRKGLINKSQVGDIGAIDAIGERLLLRHVVIECKFRRKVDLALGILRQRGLLWKWWAKACSEATTAARQPMMIVRENNTPTLLLITMEGAKRLHILGHGYLFRLRAWPSEPLVMLFDDVVPLLPKRSKV